MSLHSRLGFGLAFSLVAGLSAPLVVPTLSPWRGFAIAQVQLAQAQPDAFTDVSSRHWAHDYIDGLAKLNVINGFPDGTFQPNEPVTRAEFAAILRQAFLPSQPITAQPPFTDVPANYWATNAIYAARSAGFLAGYPGNRFEPDSPIRRDEALVSLTNGLNYTGGSPETLAIYSDADFMASYARPVIAAATQANLVINYPVTHQIGAYRSSSRAEVAAFVYQALVKEGRAVPLVAKAESWQSEPIATIPTVPEKMSLTGQQLVTLTVGGTSIQIWNALTGALLQEIAADGTTRFEAIALNKSGTKVAVISQVSPTHTVELAVWSTETGKLLWLQPLGTAKQQLRGSSLAPFVQVAFSPDDQQIMTQVSLGTSAEGDTDGQLQLQDAVTGKVLQSLDYATDGNAALRQFAFSPDGKFLASASHLSANASRARDEDRISLWRLNQNRRFDYFQTIQLVEDDFAFVDMVFTDSGLLNFLRQQIQSTRLDTWNVNTGGAYGYIELPDSDRTDTFTRLSPDGNYYFIRGDVAGSRLGNVQTGEVKNLEGYIDRTAVFGTHGDYLAISNDQNIRVFVKGMP